LKILSGMICSPRRSPKSLSAAYASLLSNGWNPILKCEPGTILPPGDQIYDVINNTERQGNFWNWLNLAQFLVNKAVSEMIHGTPYDGILICEDDALHTVGIRDFVQSRLWPDDRCGALSLYCPNVTYYRRPKPCLYRSDRPNHVGALSLLFRVECLREILGDWDSIKNWGGSHDQKRRSLPPEEIKAVDAWIGETMLKHGWHIWMCSRSLVQHYHPPDAKDNSTLNHGAATRARTAYQWIGPHADPFKVYGR